MQRAIFHLSFPVHALEPALAFYRDVLGAAPGRREAGWADLVWHGHQLTLHELPQEVPTPERRGVRHFGLILDWSEWEALRARLERQRPELATQVLQRATGSADEHVKLLLEDPSGNLIEIKAYRQLATIAPALDARR